MSARDSLSIDVVFEDDGDTSMDVVGPASGPTVLAYFSAYPRGKAQLPAPPMLPAIDTFEPRLPASSIPLPLLEQVPTRKWAALRHAPLGKWAHAESCPTVPAPRMYHADAA